MSDLTRRDFLGKASLYGGGVSIALTASLPLTIEAVAKSRLPHTLTQTEWSSVEAMTARIIPSDDTPGAIEANCVNFIDKALAHEEKAALSMVQISLATLGRHCQESWKASFSSLSAAQQNSMLATMEALRHTAWERGPK